MSVADRLQKPYKYIFLSLAFFAYYIRAKFHCFISQIDSYSLQLCPKMFPGTQGNTCGITYVIENVYVCICV